jgi:hypothetical protein
MTRRSTGIGRAGPLGSARPGRPRRGRFLAFLDASAPDLPRAVVRPAVEKLEPADRTRFVAAAR